MSVDKIFGISTFISSLPKGPYPSNERIGVYRVYPKAVSDGGAVPLLLPIVNTLSAIRRQLSTIDFLLLPGGSDLCPSHYRESNSQFVEEVCSERDRYELTLAKEAHAMGIPILGICRGLQLINVAFGGTLYRDLAERKQDLLEHRQRNLYSEASHTVSLKRSSLLCDIFGSESIDVNSYHHQAVKDLAEGFSASAIAPDGVIEGIERGGKAPIVAVQWHPELMDDDQLRNKLIHFFVSLSLKIERS